MGSKVYVEILEQIRYFIEEDGLIAGDKIPSERELAERLKVGRSSVREALRALELLGIIETRRGEGTYLKEFGEHELVGLLGGFILQREKAKEDLTETKLLIEKVCLRLGCERYNDKQLALLKEMIEQQSVQYEQFLKWVVEAADNYLLARIWLVLNDFFKCVDKKINLPLDFYKRAYSAFQVRDYTRIDELFEQYVAKQLSK